MKLHAVGLEQRFGGVTALDGVELALSSERAGIVSIIGPNGSGKTTLLDVLSGFRAPRAGTVTLDGMEITGLPPHRIARLGIVRTFQTTRLFESASVLDNVKVGSLARSRSGILDALLRTPRLRRDEREMEERAREALDQVGGLTWSHEPAGSLDHESRKRVALAMAIASAPRLLLLDEPAAGVGQAGAEHMAEILRGIVRRGITICMVEHRIRMVMSLSDQVVVLDRGRKIAEGTPAEVGRDRAVVEAYLGGGSGA